MDAKDKVEIKLLIVNTVRTTLREANEKWLSKEQLMEQFQMFTPSWMKTYGDLLPCSNASVVGLDGKSHDSRKAYPMYKIQEMIQSGAIKDLIQRAEPKTTRKVAGRTSKHKMSINQ